MDRRSWLWRRKSSEKSPGETESSGSLSSHSERFSDDQVYASQMMPSPEVMSKAATSEEEISDVKILTERLSAALLEISAKQDLVQQHAKVAEDAVSGWEKAENELLSLKQQLDAAKQKNSVLEDRVSHLDGALKECMRQLRQARDEHGEKILEVVPNGLESEKSELVRKVAELEAQIKTAKADAATSIPSDLHQKLEDMEKENSSLKIELRSRLEELEFRIIERDLSTQSAEKASKQYLESIKNVAKLEAECRKFEAECHRLKAIIRKTLSANDHRSLNSSSVCVESFTDSASDSGEKLLAFDTDMPKLGAWEINERKPSHSDSWDLIAEIDQIKNENTAGKNYMVPASEINLMDDFLEMERLAALPDTKSGSSSFVVGHASNQSNVDNGTVKAEMEAVVQKNVELENKLETMKADKIELENGLIECQKQLEASENRIKEAKLKVEELQTQLDLAIKSNEEAYTELEATIEMNEIAESKLIDAQTKVEELTSRISLLEEEIGKERALSAENLDKCEKLEDELMRIKHEAQLKQDVEALHQEGVDGEFKLKKEKKLELAASKFAECKKTIESLGQKLKSLATFEDFLFDSENPMELLLTTNEVVVTPKPQNGGGDKLKLHNSDLSLTKRDSELEPISLSQSVNYEKSSNSFGRFYPRSKSANRRGNHWEEGIMWREKKD